MIAGHFGFAALVKAREQRVPLWALMLATVCLDVVFVPLYLAHIETLTPVPGVRGGYGANIIHAGYTHSLVGALILSAIFGLMFISRWGGRCSIVLAILAFSHWVLDLVVHRHDMPLLPANLGQTPTFGFGLWRYRVCSILAEMCLVVAGAWFYGRTARSVTRSAHQGQRKAVITTILVLIGGIGVLALDVTGVIG